MTILVLVRVVVKIQLKTTYVIIVELDFVKLVCKKITKNNSEFENKKTELLRYKPLRSKQNPI